MSSQDEPEVILMPRFTGTPTTLRIRRVADGVPGPCRESAWVCADGEGGSVQAEDKTWVLARAADLPTPDMEIQNEETGEWSPRTPGQAAMSDCEPVSEKGPEAEPAWVQSRFAAEGRPLRQVHGLRDQAPAALST